MALFRSKYSVSVPSTDLLSYIFGSPYRTEGAWPSSEPLLESATEGHFRGYSIDQIKAIVKRVGCGLNQLGAEGKRVMVYGEPNIHFPLAVLGVIAAGAACNILAPGSVDELRSRLRQLDCDLVLFAPQDLKVVCTAAAQLSIPNERLFIVDETLGGEHTRNPEEAGFRHWSYLLNTPGGDIYEWPTLSPDEAKTTIAVLLYTSGYVNSVCNRT